MLVIKRGKTAQQMTRISEGHYIILPFMRTKGKPVCCVIFFQSKTVDVDPNRDSGINIKMEPLRQEKGAIDFEANIGPGNFWPGGTKY